MRTWISLLRGINVLGHNKILMKDLVSELEGLGLLDVRTYIQSGNAVFRSAEKSSARQARRIGAAIAASHGFEPKVLVLSLETFREAAAACPFPKGDAQAKTVHLFFLAEPAAGADLAAMHAVKTKTERFALTELAFYLHTPDGFGKSKLAARAERVLGVAATARNWRSVTKILAMAEELG